MITITLSGKKYKGVYSWQDITLEKYCELASIPIPDGYEAFVMADSKFSVESIDQYIQEVAKLTEEQTKAFPEYYRKVISVLTNIPEKTEMTTDQVNDLYDYYFKPFVFSLLHCRPVIHFMGQIKDYEPERISKMRIGRHVFRLPGSVRIGEENIPLYNEPIITYSEATDWIGKTRLTRGEVKKLSMFMAIYCRKWYEVRYSEKRTLRRQDLFMKAPMSAIWSVFFYTARRLPDCRLITRLFGRLPKPASEVIAVARTYRDLVTEGSYTK